MPKAEMQKSILLVSSSEKGNESIRELLSSDDLMNVRTLPTASEARRALMESSFDVIIVNAPLSDEFGLDFAVSLTQTTQSGILLLVKNNIFEQVCDKVTPSGVITVAKPITRTLFRQATAMLIAAENRFQRLQSENEKLQVKIEEIRLVDRAKLILVERLNMSETQAHRYIEKQAMDMRITKKEVASGILKMYSI